MAYVAILNTYRLTQRQGLYSYAMIQNLFGSTAQNTLLMQQGIDELTQKELIKVVDKNRKVTFYDLTLLLQEDQRNSVADDPSFFKHFKDLTISVCNQYRLYMWIRTQISKLRARGESEVLKTFKKTLADDINCSRYVIGKRLEELKENGLIVYRDCSDFPIPVKSGYETLFISLPDLEEEILCEVKRTIPIQYREGILHLDEEDEEIKEESNTQEETEENTEIFDLNSLGSDDFDIDNFVHVANENIDSLSEETQDKKEIEEGDEVAEENLEDSNFVESEKLAELGILYIPDDCFSDDD